MEPRNILSEVRAGRPRSRKRHASRSELVVPVDPEVQFADRPTREVIVPSAQRPTRLYESREDDRYTPSFDERITVPRMAPLPAEARRSVHDGDEDDSNDRRGVPPIAPRTRLQQLRFAAVGFALGFAVAVLFLQFIRTHDAPGQRTRTRVEAVTLGRE